MDKGLLIVNTGDGKGKTTAALGQAFRAIGHRKKVCVIQFIKGSRTYGELLAVEKYKDLIDIFVTGNGFTWQSDDVTTLACAKKGWELAKQKLNSQEYFMVILDELTYLMSYGLIDLDVILDNIKQRRPDLHVVVTGRYAPSKLIEAADLVTEMHEVKHPFRMGVMAQEGIEF
ncbi:cob(I)yrinic acid a,c-diamide adenosyltransferase [Desulfobacula sp.]